MTQKEPGWVKTTCAYCGVGCGVEARPTLSGQLEVRGDKSHPANYGKLCTKGAALGETVIQDGRLLTPTLTSQSRLNSKNSRQTVSWPEATSLVADQFAKAIAQYGPESVAFYVSGQLLTEDYYVANKLIKGFIGSANIDSNSRLCMASSVVGHKRAFGSDTVPGCYEDLELADLVVLVGSNLAWCHPVLYQRLRAAKQANSKLKIVVIDPRRTASCELADVHLPINSGSDVALFNGLLAYLYQHDHLDNEFLRRHTQQAEAAFKAALGECKVDEITGIPPEQLEAFYQLFANHDKVVTVYSQGVNQSTSGVDKVNSIINCHLATGRIGQPGSGPFSVTGQPNAMGGREVGALATMLCGHLEFDQPDHLAMLSEYWATDNLVTRPGLKAVDMFDAMAEGKIKAVWIMATNPAVSLPNSDKVRAALKACPFVVVSDCIEETETTKLADLLLPVQGWSEKSGTVTNSERRISRQRRILPSPGEAKPDWWVISQVGQKLGFEQAFDYLHEGEIFTEYAKLTTLGNQHFERDLSLIGLTKLDDQGYSVLTPQQWPVKAWQSEPVQQRMFSDGRFYTPSGKANLIPVSYRSPVSVVDSAYPLLLNTGRTRDQWHTMTRTGLSAQLGAFDPEPYVAIHPQTARDYQLKAEGLARVTSRHGSCLARVRLTTDQKLGEIYVPIHWNGATASQAKPCNLIAPHHDSLSGQPEFKHTPVRVTACASQCQALLLSRHTLALDKAHYWARQKVERGYAYHIDCAENIEVLEGWLSQVKQGDGKEIRFDMAADGVTIRYAFVQAEQVQQLLVIQRKLTSSQRERYITQFNSVFDATGERQFMTKGSAFDGEDHSLDK
ncbi:molybdopterin oxidoreductase family protein [Vibrio sp. WXL210]|uniref:molybdopterin oxidoreductase family protein n=1 Tax=Vibrio sp. WXL210 TaxID=3450709 RepID=UPI003EC73576